MFDWEVFKKGYIILKKKPRYGISIQLHSVEASEKKQLERDIRQIIDKRRTELYSSEMGLNSEEVEFLCREPVYEYVDNQLNYSQAVIECTWYISNSQNSVKIYSKFAYEILNSCKTLKNAIRTESFPVPEKYFSALNVQQKVSSLLSSYNQKLDIRLDPSGIMLHCRYTNDLAFPFSIDINKLLPETITVDISAKKSLK